MQLSIGAVRDPNAADCWSRLQETVAEACALVTAKELAYRLDIAPSYLNEALHEKNNKGFRLSWLPTVLLMTTETSFDSIVGTQAALRGRTLEKRKQLTPEEELVALRAAVGRMAPAVLQMADAEIGATDGGESPWAARAGSRR